ncbi:MAG: sulfite exporter TauE/SafE family protein [Tardiphaga sp.]|nr:sulfite exporter TauE/SafE family protein [Tardiphaga sp.]
MPIPFADVATLLSGGLVGFVLAVVGGGGSILAVPLLVYVVGVASPHVAIGTSAVAVAASAFVNMLSHWRAGNVRWPCAIVFSLAGIGGAFTGSGIAKQVDGQKLLVFFGMLMIGIGALMLRRRGGGGDASVRLSRSTARKLLPLLVVIGFTVGILSGFFGIGGGFLIVPGLMLATGMPMTSAIGTSLVAVVAFGASTATSYSLSGLTDWRLATIFIAGGLLGGFAGIAAGKLIGTHDRALRLTFASVVILTGGYVCIRGALQLI